MQLPLRPGSYTGRDPAGKPWCVYWMLRIFQCVLCDRVLFEQRGNKMTGAKLVGIEMAAWEREDSDKTFN